MDRMKKKRTHKFFQSFHDDIFLPRCFFLGCHFPSGGNVPRFWKPALIVSCCTCPCGIVVRSSKSCARLQPTEPRPQRLDGIAEVLQRRSVLADRIMEHIEGAADFAEAAGGLGLRVHLCL